MALEMVAPLPDAADAVRVQLADFGARPWQAELVTGALVGAILGAEEEPSPGG